MAFGVMNALNTTDPPAMSGQRPPLPAEKEEIAGDRHEIIKELRSSFRITRRKHCARAQPA